MLLLAAAGLAQEWPQFLGPARDGVYHGPALARSWPGGSPPIVWRRDVGAGFSGPVVAQDRLILFHRVNSREVVEALDAKTGNPIWKYEYPTAYRDDFGFDEGPRGTPAVAGGRVYTFGAEGVLHALDFAAGKVLWKADTRQMFGSDKGFFGYAASPLVDENRVLLNTGGRQGAGIAAFDAATGKVLWTATNDEAGYASPIVAPVGGLRRGLFFTRSGLVDADLATGKIRFQFPWRSRSQASVNAATPLVVGEDLVFLSASYGTGAVLLQIKGSEARQVWTSDDALSNHYATSVHKDGYLYGYHGRQEYGPSLRCIEARTGKVMWDEDGFRAGTITLAGDLLVILREGGELVLAPASPKEFRPLARASILPATIRAYPALADGHLYARNEKTLINLRLAAGAPAPTATPKRK
jgi:outer membrane protein assembly factor BamB